MRRPSAKRAHCFFFLSVSLIIHSFVGDICHNSLYEAVAFHNLTVLFPSEVFEWCGRLFSLDRYSEKWRKVCSGEMEIEARKNKRNSNGGQSNRGFLSRVKCYSKKWIPIIHHGISHDECLKEGASVRKASNIFTICWRPRSPCCFPTTNVIKYKSTCLMIYLKATIINPYY